MFKNLLSSARLVSMEPMSYTAMLLIPAGMEGRVREPWGGEAGVSSGRGREEAGAQGARKQAGVITVIHDGIKINLGCLK